MEAKNNAESMCFHLEKLLKEHDAFLNQTDKDAIHSAIGQTREAILSEDLSKIKSATVAQQTAAEGAAHRARRISKGKQSRNL